MSGLTLARLLADPAALDALPREHVPDALAEIERIRARLWARLMAASVSIPAPAPERDNGRPDRLITVAEAAEVLSVRPRWLYDHADTLPFTRRPGARTLRFSERGLHRWLESRR